MEDIYLYSFKIAAFLKRVRFMTAFDILELEGCRQCICFAAPALLET